MADNIEIEINGRMKFTGRLIGLINDEEYRAIKNTEDAPRRIFTAGSMKLSDLESPVGKMFVVATSNYSESKSRLIFVSPKVRFTSVRYGSNTWRCEDNNDYTLRQLQ